MLITLEGIDGTGKSTLHAALGDALADLNPVMTREPGATWIGESVRRAIAEDADPIAEALLFAADHAAHLAGIIRPALTGGQLVISDRYIDSRYAYQQVTLASILEDPLSWLRAVHGSWTILPDMTFLLMVPVDIALERTGMRERGEHFEQRDILEMVQERYLELATAEPVRFTIIDATLPPGQILRFVTETIRSRIRCG